MTGLAASPPAGAPTPPLTGPEFNAFILLTDSRGGRHQSSGAARSIVLRTARPPKAITLFPAPPAPQRSTPATGPLSCEAGTTQSAPKLPRATLGSCGRTFGPLRAEGVKKLAELSESRRASKGLSRRLLLPVVRANAVEEEGIREPSECLPRLSMYLSGCSQVLRIRS